MINDVFVKKEVKRWKVDVNIDDDSKEVIINQRDSGVRDPVWMMASAHERFALTAQSTRNLADFRPRQFLD